ncbi:hypothetical protein [Aquipseudomonas ullengensis]|nr:hypothetical protein [Pseudomonas ullengensis]
MNKTLLRGLLGLALAALLALAWWGWQSAGLALLQLDMPMC